MIFLDITMGQFAFIGAIPIGLAAIGLLIVLIRNKAKQHHMRLLGLLLLVSIISYAITMITRNVFKINPNYSQSIFNIFDFAIITMIYNYVTEQKHEKKFVTLIVIFTAFAITNLLFIQKHDINSYTLIIMSIIIIPYALYYFYWLIQKLPTTQLHRLPMFWLNSALIIFYAGNLFLFVFTSYLVHVLNNQLLVYWSLHNILKTIETLMIIGALWVDLQNLKLRSL